MKLKRILPLSLIIVLTGCEFNFDIFNSSESSNVSSEEYQDISIESLDKALVKKLKESWYSEIYYPDITIDEAIIAQFVSSIDNRTITAQQDPYTYLIKNATSTSGVTYNGKMGITIVNTFNYPVVSKIEKGFAADGILNINDIIVALGKYNERTHSYNYHYISDSNYNFSSLVSSVAGNLGDKVGVKFYRLDENNKLVLHEESITLGAIPEAQIAYVEDTGIEDTLTVKMTGFEDATYNQLHQILKDNENSKEKKHNIIFDLQDNGGGSLSSLVNICDLFLEKDKTVTYLVDKYQNTFEKKTGSKIEEYEFDNYIFLVNENTASASEVFIKCMEYYFKDNMTLIGNKTYGKGIATNTIAIDDDASYYLQYTYAKWLNPAKEWIGLYLGIEPNSTISYTDAYSFMRYYYGEFDFNNDIVKDNVSISNQFLATILNLKYNYSMRVDGYFDSEYEDYIKQYQTLKGINSTGLFTEETMVYVVQDFINEKEDLQDRHLNKAIEWINLN